MILFFGELLVYIFNQRVNAKAPNDKTVKLVSIKSLSWYKIKK